MWTWTLIVLGGALGTGLRYGLAGLSQRLSPGTFPVGTLTVNVLGCLAIGLLAAWFSVSQAGADIREEVQLALLVGVLGGFTTFSSFGLETLRLMHGGQTGQALLYVFLSNGLGLLAVWIGWRSIVFCCGS